MSRRRRRRPPSNQAATETALAMLTLARSNIDDRLDAALWSDEWAILVPRDPVEMGTVLHSLVGLSAGLVKWVAEAEGVSNGEVLGRMGAMLASGFDDDGRSAR